MIDITPSITSALAEATHLPVQYELFLDSSTILPAITYQLYNTYDVATGDTISYSMIQYMIKLWGNDITSMTAIKQTIDITMKEKNFKLINYGELAHDDELCMLMIYEGIAEEAITQEEN